MNVKKTPNNRHTPSGGDMTESGPGQLPTYQQILDESLAETFPASPNFGDEADVTARRR